jgi:hypothetical protein
MLFVVSLAYRFRGPDAIPKLHGLVDDQLVGGYPTVPFPMSIPFRSQS